MAKATRPVSINDLEFDALIDSERTLEATVPEYAVEAGYAVSDSIILSAEVLNMTLFVTNTPVTWAGRFSSVADRVSDVEKRLEEMYFSRELVKVITSDRTFTNMAIESIGFRKSVEVGYALEIPVAFRKVNVTTEKTTTIPDSYGKSGATNAGNGSANTTSGSTDSGSSGGGGGNNSSGDSGDGEKGSILYGVADSLGLLD